MAYIVNEKIEDYCLKHSSTASPLCNEIEAYTKQNVALPQMLIGPLEASFLKFIIQSTRAKRILEIGCFTGYSALSMAEAIPADGEIITLDINEANANIAKSFWAKSEAGKKIKLILGEALKSIKNLNGPFDLVFIDADKRNYLNYFHATLPLLSPRGIILADNCLWSGRVITDDNEKDTLAIKEFNDYIAARADLVKSLIPLRDGILAIGVQSPIV